MKMFLLALYGLADLVVPFDIKLIRADVLPIHGGEHGFIRRDIPQSGFFNVSGKVRRHTVFTIIHTPSVYCH
jgi:hypothetical protein